jgi:hypothetical protein
MPRSGVALLDRSASMEGLGGLWERGFNGWPSSQKVSRSVTDAERWSLSKVESKLGCGEA